MATEMTDLRCELDEYDKFAIWIPTAHLPSLEQALIDVAKCEVTQTITIEGNEHRMDPRVAEAFLDAIDELENEAA